MSQEQRILRSGYRRPADVFRECPACESKNIFSFEGDVFCVPCDWNSIISRAEARSASQEAAAQNHDFGAVDFISDVRETDTLMGLGVA